MKIYIGHSRNFDYINELYEPILNSNINKEHDIILPHKGDGEFNSQEMIKASDLFIAEVSYPSLGLGIEIGRAESIGKKILCIYKENTKCPSSLKFVNVDIMKYKHISDLEKRLENYITTKEN